MPLRVRASVCGRGERDRDILEAREAGELGRRQARQPVAVQLEVPVGNTHEQGARANASFMRWCAHECVWPRVSTLHVLYAVRTVSPLKHLDTHRKRHKSALSLTDAHPHSIHTRPTEIHASYGYSSLRMRERYTKRGGRKARLATGKALLGRALHVPLRVRASVCGRAERDRDIPEAREAGELGRRQARQLVALQIDAPVVNTHEQGARARACTSADARVSRATNPPAPSRRRMSLPRHAHARVRGATVCARVCIHPRFQRVREGDRGRQVQTHRRAPMSEKASSAHDVMPLLFRLREVQSVAHDPVRASGAPS